MKTQFKILPVLIALTMGISAGNTLTYAEAKTKQQSDYSVVKDPIYIQLGNDETGILKQIGEKKIYSITSPCEGLLNVDIAILGEHKDISNAICSIYDKNGEEITYTKDFSKPIEVFVERGKYYIEVTGAKAEYKLKTNFVSYEIKHKLNNKGLTNKNVTVKLSYGFDAEKIVAVEGYYDKNTCKDVIKSKKVINCKNNVFTLKGNGLYTVIVKDKKGNHVTKTITVSNIDKDAPIIIGVSNNTTYNRNVTINFWDEHKTTATLNGKAIKDGKTVKKNGKYSLVVKDEAGNTSEIKFTIDK